ncbi:MAG: hypothetical protein ACKO3K_03745 [Cuspidothrix sp.]
MFNRLHDSLQVKLHHWISPFLKEEALVTVTKGGASHAEQCAVWEERLYEADVSPALVQHIMQACYASPASAPPQVIHQQLRHCLESVELPAFLTETQHLPPVLILMVVGINGVGKTTTLGKLAHWFNAHHSDVTLAGCDTFRAAADSQLAVWAERSGTTFLRGEHGQDPTAVAYQACQQVLASVLKNKEEEEKPRPRVLLIDTAGRLHNNGQLLAQLEKMQRSLQKLLASMPAVQATLAPLFVVDATQGQSVLQQIEQFQTALQGQVAGLCVTKLDTAPHSGMVFNLAHRFQLLPWWLGTGEQLTDLHPFDPNVYLNTFTD